MSSGQSERNGSSVEPGLPNTFLMPKARNRLNVASLTVTDFWVLAGLRDDNALSFLSFRGARSANPESRGSGFDADASPRNDGVKTSPRRRPLHGRLPLGVCRPHLHAAAAVIIGVDRELAALEQRLQAAIDECLRRLAAVQLGRKLDDERRLKRAVEY